jgi:hypothetical protein
VEVDVYAESGPLTFTRSVLKVPIFEYTIVCDVSVTQEAPVGRGKAAKLAVKITKQQLNKITKHMVDAGK